MSGTRRNGARRVLVTIALGAGIVVLAPVFSSFVVFSSGSHTHFPGEGETTTIYKNDAMPAWIAAAIGGQNIETAVDDTSIIDSALI